MADRPTTPDEPFQLEEATIDELHQAIREGRTTCAAVVRRYIDRVRAFNGVASALVTEDGAPIPAVTGAVRARQQVISFNHVVAADHAPARRRQQLRWRDIYRVLVESAEISAVVMIIISLAGVFAHAGSTLGAFDAFAQLLIGVTSTEWIMLLMIMLMLLVAGMLLDAVSIFLVFLPILVPIANTFHWDLVWFGVLLTMNMAIGQFTPPMAVNLMVTTRIAGVSMESTVRWVIWMVGAMLIALTLVAIMPQLALWLPRTLGY